MTESDSEGETFDVGSLLSIDVESELRKLTAAQLQGAWELPAELVRNAVRRKAKRVVVRLDRNFVRVTDDGISHSDATLASVRRTTM